MVLLQAQKDACSAPVSYTHLDVYKRQVLQNLEEVIRLLGTWDITTIRASMGMYLLRKAFEGDWLPPEILWREKAAFSDAVGHSMRCV